MLLFIVIVMTSRQNCCIVKQKARRIAQIDLPSIVTDGDTTNLGDSAQIGLCIGNFDIFRVGTLKEQGGLCFVSENQRRFRPFELDRATFETYR
jgi:hypothetical protein